MRVLGQKNYRVEMYVQWFIAQFFMAISKKKKIRPITLIVWLLGRVEKMPKKREKKKEKKIFWFKQSVTLLLQPVPYPLKKI